MYLTSLFKLLPHRLVAGISLCVLFLLASTSAQTIYADPITVPCDPTALATAITTANSNPGSDNLTLTGGCIYILSSVDNTDPTYGNNGLPVITSKVVINGSGATITRNSQSLFRLFMVSASGQLRLKNLTLSGGLTQAGSAGAAVPNGNPGPNNTPGDPGPPGNPGSDGQPGGAIVNLGKLFLNQVTFSENATGFGGTGSAGGAGGKGGNADKDKDAGAGGTGGVGGSGGNGGNGGAIYNAGTLTDHDSTFTLNTTGFGAQGGNGGIGGDGGVGSDTVTPLTGKTGGGDGGNGGDGGIGGNSGSGAAIFNDVGGIVLLNGTQLQNNYAGDAAPGGTGGAAGNGGSGSNNAVNSSGGNGGWGGAGGIGGSVGAGGVIFNAGNLTVIGASFTAERGSFAPPQAGNGGNAGTAGTGGQPQLNFDGSTGGSGGEGGGGGSGGDGTGIASTGILTVSDTTFSSLPPGSGGNGGKATNGTAGTSGATTFTGQLAGDGGQGGDGGDGGDGGSGGRGAIAVLSGTATIVTSTFYANSAGTGGAGQDGGNGGKGGPGITASSQAGQGGIGGDGGDGGDAGATQGGAIYNAATLVLANSTLVVNYTNINTGIFLAGNGGTGGDGGNSVDHGPAANWGGDAGNGGDGGGGPLSQGGGVYNTGSAQLINVTLSQNLLFPATGDPSSGGAPGTPGRGIQHGKDGKDGATGAPSTADGANLANSGGTLALANTIVDNTSLTTTPTPPFPPGLLQNPNCMGTLTDGGNNLDSDGSCSLSSGTTNPQLSSAGLADNGGPTQTIAIPLTSPAIDTGNNSICAAAPINGVDQRGTVRPQDVNCDIGAFELNFNQQSNPFTVNTLNDGPLGTCNTTTCTLRDAIHAANNLGSPATVQFSVTGAVNVTEDPIAITNDMTIVGPADGSVSINLPDGQTQPQLFTIAPNLDVTLSNLNVTNSSLSLASQATIMNHGNLTLNNFELSGNSSSTGPQLLDAYNINSDGTLNIVNSTFTGNTGAVLNSSGTLSISGSTFNNNESFGNLITLTGNSTIVNSTFTANELFQPLITNSGPLTIVNSTFANDTNLNNGATELQGTQITAQNSIFSSATTACASPIADGGNNLDNGDSCGLSTANNSLVNTDPQLDDNGLQDNGGPTQTIALRSTSPALEVGNNAICAAAPVKKVDQRGVKRPQGLSCDLGAFELELGNQSNPFTVNTTSDGPVRSCTFTNCTLRDAIAAANALGSPATVQIGVPGTIALSGTKMALTNAITIVGPTKTTVTLDLTNQPELFALGENANITLSNVIIQNASPADQQVTFANVNFGSLTLDNVTFQNNLTTDGLFFNNSGTLNIKNSSLQGNQGMLLQSSGTVNISASTLALNQTGGSLITLDGIATVSNSTFANNTQAGPVLSSNGSLAIYNSTFSQNTNNGGTTQSEDVEGPRVTATNSIFASGISCAAPITDGGSNIETGDTCGFSAAKGSLVNTDPLLDPNGLANNGGPTYTITLQATSPALDAGIDSVCQAAPVNGLDQRGAARSKGPHCDIGAVEASISYPPPACEGAPKLPILAKPRQGTVVEGDKAVLKWKKQTCAAFYALRIRAVQGKQKQTIKQSVAQPRLVLTSLQPDTLYHWRVRACNVNGCSKWTLPRTFSTKP